MNQMTPYNTQYSYTIWRKILTVEIFDKLGVRKNLTSKILTNCISLTCKQLLEEKFEWLNFNELLKIHQICQYFPLSKFCAVR